jgi:hypothetical protein
MSFTSDSSPQLGLTVIAEIKRGCARIELVFELKGTQAVFYKE